MSSKENAKAFLKDSLLQNPAVTLHTSFFIFFTTCQIEYQHPFTSVSEPQRITKEVSHPE